MAPVVAGDAWQRRTDVDGIPIYSDVAAAMADTGANVSVVFVPPRFAKGAVEEAVDAGIPLAVVITEGIPVHDTAQFFQYAQNSGATRIIGPNCPGIISPVSRAGIIPADITQPGRIGLVSKSGTLTYQMMYELRDIGFSTCVGIGGDHRNHHIDCLAAFQDDPDTDAIVMIGEIGGDAEERAAAFIAENVRNPSSDTSWLHCTRGKTMGHAGAIVLARPAPPRLSRGARGRRRQGRPHAERSGSSDARGHGWLTCPIRAATSSPCLKSGPLSSSELSASRSFCMAFRKRRCLSPRWSAARCSPPP